MKSNPERKSFKTDSDKRRSGNNYTYERTVVGIGEESDEVKALRRESSSSNSPIQYSEDGENWMDVGSNPVKFIYTADAKGEVPKTIKTADTRNLINIIICIILIAIIAICSCT